MNQLTETQINQIKNWIYRNARPLELTRWQYHFENGSQEAVLAVLAAYQNEDGGFGHAIEADSWNPDSSPYSTSTVIDLLDEIHFTNKNHPIIKGILRYLNSTADFTGKYWLALIPTNDHHPHAPWWTFNDHIKADWGYTPTAKLAGFILRFADADTTLYAKAKEIAKEATEQYLHGVTSEGKPYAAVDREGEVAGFLYLLKSLEEMHMVEVCELSMLKKALKQHVDTFISRDPAQWKQYCRKPSVYIDSPESIFFEGNEDILHAELDYILSNRNEAGVWNINWSWGAYEKEFAVSENWWKAVKAIEYRQLLKSFQ